MQVYLFVYVTDGYALDRMSAGAHVTAGLRECERESVCTCSERRFRLRQDELMCAPIFAMAAEEAASEQQSSYSDSIGTLSDHEAECLSSSDSEVDELAFGNGGFMFDSFQVPALAASAPAPVPMQADSMYFFRPGMAFAPGFSVDPLVTCGAPPPQRH